MKLEQFYESLEKLLCLVTLTIYPEQLEPSAIHHFLSYDVCVYYM